MEHMVMTSQEMGKAKATCRKEKYHILELNHYVLV